VKRRSHLGKEHLNLAGCILRLGSWFTRAVLEIDWLIRFGVLEIVSSSETEAAELSYLLATDVLPERTGGQVAGASTSRRGALESLLLHAPCVSVGFSTVH
jgi:hypothetical protein